MKKNKEHAKLLTTALMALFLTVQTHAELYAGGSIGVTDPGGTGKTSNMFRLHAGYRFIDYLALEIAATNFGTIDTEPPIDSSTELESIEYGLMGSFPFLQSHSVFIRVGYHKWDADVSVNDDVFGNVRGSIDGDDIFYGIGYAKEISDMGAVRIEINRYKFLDDGEIDTLSLGLEAHF